MEKFSLNLYNPQQAHKAIAEAWLMVKAELTAGRRVQATFSECSKSREQEEKYHAMIGEIHRDMKSAGSEWSQDDWKRLLIDQWAQDSAEAGTRIVPSLDGKRIVQLGLQSRKFTVSEGSSFIEWLYAWGTQKGVTFKDMQ